MLPRLPIVAHQHAVLRLRVHHIGILGIDRAEEPIAAGCHEPIGIGNARSTGRLRWTAHRKIVLRPAIHEVEWLRVVDGNAIELDDREIWFVVPCCSAIEALVQSAVAAHEIVVRVVGIDPDGMVIDMLVFFAEVLKRFAAVIRNFQIDIHRVHAIDVLRIAEDLAVVLRAAVCVIAPLFPRRATIQRPIETTFPVRQFHNCKQHVRVHRRNGKANASHIAGGQTGGQLVPSLSRINGFVDCRLRSPVDQRKDMTPALIRRGV